jgi:twitching motility protein PilT
LLQVPSRLTDISAMTASTPRAVGALPAVTHSAASNHSELVGRLLDECIARGASDLHITPGSPPVGRINGELVPLTPAMWGADATEVFCRDLAGDHWHEVEHIGTADFGLAHPSGNRFRANVMRQRSGYSAVLRRISETLLTFEEIGLPATIVDLLQRPRGLVLVTGPTGSGKSTTLATMINWINSNLDRHIVTIEDPVEFFHHHKKGLVTQREVGADVPDFVEAMRRVLRQDPDVIMLGEMRDLETISAAVSAAETGHLVLGTMHTTGSATTVSRIIDAFPGGEQEQIRVQLAMSLSAVISQVLLPSIPSPGEEGIEQSGRVAGLEVMTMTPAIANQIRNNDVNRINDVIQTSRHLGMFRLDDHLLQLIQQGRVHAEDAMVHAQDPAALAARVSGSGSRNPAG